ncbi:STAS domain-containing protein [Cytobacillus firmus]|uniref:STAS domain-containing protein n=1 Tax=Cytobacillus firmus TaxID=1399 RepID=UPI00064E8715|nr:STAS domain-containing protein [Cytobacillus firmus]KML41113.1 positive regulator of sigma-B activity [Cytobacillus firmus]WHY60166.1 STAS domain-containing protein [Cytobacillus firmus]
METNSSKYEINVNGSLFDWDLDNATFKFENDEVVVFWVNTAFKTLLDSIEEISGEKSAELVLETAGYRTGKIVSKFYLESNKEKEDIINHLPNMYLTAGWGKTDIASFSLEEKKAIIRVKNGWEYKINVEQKKEAEGTFLPGHWAGVLSGLFETNIWYKVKQSQVKGDYYSEYEFFESDITPSQNISALIKEQNQSAQKKLEKEIAEQTKVMSEIIKEISSPIIPVIDSILVIPLVGRYEELRAEELLNRTLLNLPRYKAEYLILDLTALKGVDQYTLDFLQKFVKAASLLGTNCIFVGISPELSLQIIESGNKETQFPCFSVLQQGITHALDQVGLQISPKK